MDETTSAMQLANQLIAKAPTEDVLTNDVKENIMADTTTRNIFNATPSVGGMDGFGLGGTGAGGIGGFLMGALLARSGIFGNQGGEVANSQQMITQDLGDIKAGVATSALQTQAAVNASNMDINATLFNQSGLIQSQLAASALNNANSFAHTNQYVAQGLSNLKDATDVGFMSVKDAVTNGTITGLQSDSAILAAAANNHAAIEKTAAEIALGVERAGAASITATMAAANQSALQNANLQALIDRNAFVLAEKVSADGTLTRNLLIQQNDAMLNRELSTAQAEIIELRNERRLADRTREVEVNVSQNVNQNQLQAQTQAQLQQIGNVLGALASEIATTKQSIVNIGSGSARGTASSTAVL